MERLVTKLILLMKDVIPLLLMDLAMTDMIPLDLTMKGLIWELSKNLMVERRWILLDLKRRLILRGLDISHLFLISTQVVLKMERLLTDPVLVILERTLKLPQMTNQWLVNVIQWRMKKKKQQRKRRKKRQKAMVV
jgi:hypothetical protein